MPLWVSFQAKIGSITMRKREKKIIAPFRSVPIRHVIENFKKINNKIKKIKKYHYGFILSQNRLGTVGKERK